MMGLAKYSGHTGPWRVGNYSLIDKTGTTIAIFVKDDDFPEQEANIDLATDAPVLLNEVRRLQKVIADIAECEDIEEVAEIVLPELE